jgi:hypothetical protein
MTDKAISPLRRRLIEDMTIRRLGPGTQRQYIRHVKSFADFVGRSPDNATPEDVRRCGTDSPARLLIAAAKSQERIASVGGLLPADRIFAVLERDFLHAGAAVARALVRSPVLTSRRTALCWTLRVTRPG